MGANKIMISKLSGHLSNPAASLYPASADVSSLRTPLKSDPLRIAAMIVATSFSLSLCVSISLCQYLCICISVSVCVSGCVCISMSVCLCLYLCVCISVFICLCLYLCVSVSVYVSLCQCLSLGVPVSTSDFQEVDWLRVRDFDMQEVLVSWSNN